MRDDAARDAGVLLRFTAAACERKRLRDFIRGSVHA